MLTTVVACRVSVRGVVQGVGFRPFVYNLATRLGLRGAVRNTADGVEIEVEGAPVAVDEFLEDLEAEPPPLAHIDEIRVDDVEPRDRRSFTIQRSRDHEGFLPIAPDVATCPACLREIRNPPDRRFGYPFTNCTDCGPRFTIIRAMPYDRPRTTMAGFTMCAACRAEYEDPRDRRFHAQPNACPACGPRLVLVDATGPPLAGEPLVETRRLLAAGGRIVAIKGVGGFHLACDATNEAAVRRLRERKRREAKPLALMVADLGVARRLCRVSDEESALLTSPARPIVILKTQPDCGVAPSVAMGLDTLGVMLPYSPLHYLLLRGDDGGPQALVMTSGNRSDEPIATDNADALARLGGIADAFLVHDRPIHVRCDDSVTRVTEGGELPMRRSRGYAPLPVRLPFEARPLLAVGAELKNTICVTRGPYAFMSPHVGDLGDHETSLSHRAMVEHMLGLFRVRPEAVAHDLHPDYLSTHLAASLDLDVPRIPVQHHHAHVAGCMAEHRLTGPVIGVAFDGAGYGTDGAVWGGEFIVADYAGFERIGHLGYVPMPGGDRAAREPFRMALAHLAAAGVDWDERCPAVAAATETERQAIRWQIEQAVNAPPTSSVGRLFDAVASILGVRHRARYEAQAAMELEALADRSIDPTPYPIEVSAGAPLIVDPGPMIRAVAVDIAAGVPARLVAVRFHATVAAMVLRVAERVRVSTGLSRAALSGGVFQNVTVLAATRRRLKASGFEVFSHRLVPPNDGGLALGQAVVAHARLSNGGGA